MAYRHPTVVAVATVLGLAAFANLMALLPSRAVSASAPVVITIDSAAIAAAVRAATPSAPVAAAPVAAKPAPAPAKVRKVQKAKAAPARVVYVVPHWHGCTCAL
jgi:hypothetical protein